MQAESDTAEATACWEASEARVTHLETKLKHREQDLQCAKDDAELQICRDLEVVKRIWESHEEQLMEQLSFLQAQLCTAQTGSEPTEERSQQSDDQCPAEKATSPRTDSSERQVEKTTSPGKYSSQ